MEYLKEVNVELIFSICAIVISMVSIIIGVRYNRKTFNYTKEQNKLTLEPFLSIESDSCTDNTFVLTLINNGNGLARLISVDYLFKGKKHQSLLVLLGMDGIIKKIELDILLKESFSFLTDGLAHIGNGKEIILFSLKFKEGFNIREFDEILMNVKTVIHYENIYRDKKRLETVITDRNTYKDV